MTLSELLNEILKEFNLMQSSKRKNIALFGEISTRLIQQVKVNWEKEAIKNYLNKLNDWIKEQLKTSES